MNRRVMLNNISEDKFVKPEGAVILVEEDTKWSLMYPVLDGVEVYVYDSTTNMRSNWLGLELYDSNKNLVKTLNWQNTTTLRKDECCYFKARMCHYAVNKILGATWL